MLYDIWRDIARQRGGELALWDRGARRRWRFRELAQAAETAERCAAPVVFPRGNGAEFILTLLRAWRAGAVVCPLEMDQALPRWSSLPAGGKHLKLTSATSGSARMVVFSEAQLAADARNIVQTMRLRPEWANLGAISLAHSYGFSNLVLPLLLHGIPLILAPSPLPEMVRRAAAGHLALSLAGVPALWRAWHEAEAIPDNVRLAISAGAPLSIELERAVHETRGLKIHNFYGSSECGGIAYDDTPLPREEEGLVGRALCGVDLRLNGEGCLAVRSEAVGQGYWPKREASLEDGCFLTGDLAEIHSGSIYLRGRIGDLINVAGRKVSPGVIEQALRRHPSVKDCLVFGAAEPLGERGERIVACVVADGRGGAEPLKQFLLRRLPAWQAPRDWWFVDSLNINCRGKISRAEWRRRYEESALRAPQNGPASLTHR